MHPETWAVLATGPSMRQSIADCVREKCKVVAVSDAWRLAPWADALMSADAAWWHAHTEALTFAGERLCLAPNPPEGVEKFRFENGANSGLAALAYAVAQGARKVILLGIDLHSPGEHFFGRHPEPLKSTNAHRMEVFKRQFAKYRPLGVDIVNASPNSALDCYRRGLLEEEL